MLLWLASPMSAAAGELTAVPVLRIESGAHTADITGLATSAAGDLIATASFDKTIRLWQLDRLGEGPRVLRVPIDADSREGALYAVALSPDGRTLVAGGWTGSYAQAWSLYVFEVASGRMSRRIADLPQRAVSLAYSADGGFLAIGLKSGGGVQLRNTRDWSVVATDTAYADDVPSLHFAADGRLAVASHDGSVTVYRGGLSRAARVADPTGLAPAVVRFAPDGRTIAIGHAHDPRVLLLNGEDLSVRATLDAPDRQAGFTALEWSADGRFVFGAGSYERGGVALVRRWTVGSQRSNRDFPAAHGSITQLLRLRTDRLAFVTAQASFGILDDRGEPWWTRRFAGPDFRDQQESLRIAADAGVVEFSFERVGLRRARLSLRERSLADGVAADPGLLDPILEVPGLAITGWRQTKAPALNGRPIALMPHETATSLAIQPGGTRFVLGTAWRVVAFDAKGMQLWSRDAPSAAWALNVTADGAIVVGAFGDGTLRWLRMRDGAELLALFATAEPRRWVAWTSAGFYAASAGGDRLVGWHVNRGSDQAADFFTVSRLRRTHNRPEAIEDALAKGAAAPDAADGTETARGAAGITDLLPPVIDIVSPAGDRSFDSPRLALVYEIRAAPPGGPARVLIRADGRPIAEFAEPSAAHAAGRQRSVEIEVPRRDHVLEAIVEAASGVYSEPAAIHLHWTGETAERKPRLFVAAVGIDKYRSRDLELKFSVKDSRDFSAALRKGEPGTYRRVSVRQLANEAATAPAIRDALEWLRTSVGPEDVAVLFLSGHGFQDRSGRYYYLPVNVSSDEVFSRGLPDSEIREGLARIRGRVLLFLDTCRSAAVWGYASGRVDVARLVNDLSSPEIGAYVFASSSGTQASFESPQWQNGAFSKALVEGLGGKADLFNTKVVTVSGLDAYLSHRVAELTFGRQTPATGKPVAIDLPLLRLK